MAEVIERPEFGARLRTWRKRRAKSQLDLSLLAGYSQRHLSFIESGRARPSRNAVLTLCDTLSIPLPERNALLTAAGFAPIYQQRRLDDPVLEPLMRSITAMVDRQAPFPALVLDESWNLEHANAPAIALFTYLIGGPPPSTNVLEVCFDERGLKPHFADWEVVAHHFIRRLEAEITANPDNEALAELAARLAEALPAAPDHAGSEGNPLSPVETLVFRHGDTRLSFFSMIATIGTPQDVTLARLRLETFVPADEETHAFLIRLLSQDSTNVDTRVSGADVGTHPS